MKLIDQTMWALVDGRGTYMTEVFPLRRDAQARRKEHDYIIDASWRIAKVRVREVRPDPIKRR